MGFLSAADLQHGEQRGAPATIAAAIAPTTPPAIAPVFGPELLAGAGLADATVWEPVRKPAGRCRDYRLLDWQMQAYAAEAGWYHYWAPQEQC